MLSNKQFNAVFDAFRESANNANAPIKKPFSSGSGKWCIATNRSNNIVTWYEMTDGVITKYFDDLPV